MVDQTVPTIADRWRLVRGASIARNLRHLLLILMHYQGKNDTVWCRRESLRQDRPLRPGDSTAARGHALLDLR